MQTNNKVSSGLSGMRLSTPSESAPKVQRALGVMGRVAGAVASSLPGMGAIGAGLGTAGGSSDAASGMEAMRAMQQESQAMQLQYMQLQQAVQDDNRRFSTASNILRAGHDTQKAAIQNIRS